MLPNTVQLPCHPNTTLLLLGGCRVPFLHCTPQNSAFLPSATLLYAALRLRSCTQHSSSVPLCVCYGVSAAHTCFRHMVHSAAVASCTPSPVSTAATLKYSSLLAALDTVLLPYVPPTALMRSGPVGVLFCVFYASTYSLHLLAHFFVTCDSILPVVCRVRLRRPRVCPLTASATSLLVAAPLLPLLWVSAMSLRMFARARVLLVLSYALPTNRTYFVTWAAEIYPLVKNTPSPSIQLPQNNKSAVP